jgi:hypothetical protein
MTRRTVRMNLLPRLGLSLTLLILVATQGIGLFASSRRGTDRAQLVRLHHYFPLHTGYRWVYAIHGGLSARGTWEVNVGDEHAGSYHELSGYFGRNVRTDVRMVGATLPANVVERGDNGQDYLWYEFDGRVGRSWIMRFPPGENPGCEGGATLSIGARDEVISVPAGEFKQVIRIDFITACADAGIMSEWFAPGVGLIRREESTIAGPLVSELVYAELGQTVLPEAAYSTSLILSSPRYVNNLMPPVDPSQLPRVTGVVVVRNQTDEPVELVFPSSCRGVRLDVRNQAGELVLVKSTLEGVVCAQVVERVVLTRRALVVPFSFALADEAGRPLPDGSYSLTAVLLTGVEALQPAARAKIEVSSTH